MSNPDTTIYGLAAAAEIAGVNPVTIQRWAKSGYFSEGEAVQIAPGGAWEFDRDALLRVRQTALTRGRGAWKAAYLRFYDAPPGHVVLRIDDLPDHLLVGLMYEYAETHLSTIQVVGSSHHKATKIRDKGQEILNEIRKRGLQPQLPMDFVGQLSSTTP
jgi:hypothetical protein